MKHEEINRWLKSIAISFVIFFILSLYLFLRRGYYNLYIINKVLGSSAIVISGFTLLVGPLSKRFPYFTKFMTIRKHLGLSAFGLALLHILVSLLQQERFPFPTWYIRELIPVTFGILAILLWSYMTYISRIEKIKVLGVEKWKKRLSLAGQLGFLAIFLHLTIMKYPGWLRWASGQLKSSPELANPSYPPASLFIFIIIVAIILYRIKHR